MSNNHNHNSENLSTSYQHLEEIQLLKKKIELETQKSQSYDQKILQIKQKINAAKQKIQQKKLKLQEVQKQITDQKQKGQKQPLLSQLSQSSQFQSSSQSNTISSTFQLTNDRIISQLREHFKALRMQMMSELQCDDFDDDDYEDEVDVDNMTYEELLELGERIGKVSKGLDTKKMQALAVKKYKKESNEATAEECAICRQELEQDTECIELPCKHIFHQDCIKGWLNVEKHCPNCKREINLQSEEKPKQLHENKQ